MILNFEIPVAQGRLQTTEKSAGFEQLQINSPANFKVIFNRIQAAFLFQQKANFWTQGNPPAILFISAKQSQDMPAVVKIDRVFWLKENGFETTDALVEKLFTAAKQTNRLFTDAELTELASA